MVQSSIYNRLFNGKSKRGGSLDEKPHTGYKPYNVVGHMMGGKKSTSSQKGGQGVNNLLRLLNDKKEFLIATFANLFAQLGITYYVMMNYNGPVEKNSSTDKQNKEPLGTFLGLFALQIIIILVLAFVSMPSWFKILLFSVFSGSFGVMLSYLAKIIDPNLLKFALSGTMGIFLTMMILGIVLIVLGVNLGLSFAAFLFFSLLSLIIVEGVSLFLGSYDLYSKIFAGIGLFIFSLYIIYDTNHILQREYYGDFITASLDYYLDIINVFLDLISLGGDH
jgi:hypothetical protein